MIHEIKNPQWELHAEHGRIFLPLYRHDSRSDKAYTTDWWEPRSRELIILARKYGFLFGNIDDYTYGIIGSYFRSFEYRLPLDLKIRVSRCEKRMRRLERAGRV